MSTTGGRSPAARSATSGRTSRMPAGAGVFRDIVDVGGGSPATAMATSFTVTPALRRPARCACAPSTRTPTACSRTSTRRRPRRWPRAHRRATRQRLPRGGRRRQHRACTSSAPTCSSSSSRSSIAERHAAGEDLLEPAAQLARAPSACARSTARFNNLVHGQTEFGASDTLFPLLLDPEFRNDQDGDVIDIERPGCRGGWSPTPTTPAPTQRRRRRSAHHLEPDRRPDRQQPGGVRACGESVTSPGLDGIFGTADDRQVYLHPEHDAGRRPVGALQHLDDVLRPVLRPRPRPGRQGRQRHGLHTAAAGRSAATVPAQRGDQLHGADARHPVRRSRRRRRPRHGRRRPSPRSNEQTTPFVDQNQTYTSHPSHQVFLREYELNATAIRFDRPLITNRNLVRRRVRQRRRRRTRRHGHTGPRSRRRRATCSASSSPTPTSLNVPLLATDALRQVHSRPPTASRSSSTGARPDGLVEARPGRQRWPRQPRCRPTRCAPAMPSWTTSRTTPRPCSARRAARDADADDVIDAGGRPDRPAPTTTNCSTRTSSPATAVATRTSA